MFLHICSHGDRVVGELIVPGLRWPDAQRLRSGPVLSVDDWSEQPFRVGLIVDGQMASLLATHRRREMKNLNNIAYGHIIIEAVYDCSINDKIETEHPPWMEQWHTLESTLA